MRRRRARVRATRWRAMTVCKFADRLKLLNRFNGFCPTGKSLLIFRNRVKPRNQKYFASPLTQIRCISKPSRPDRGAFRDRHGRWAGDAVDAAASGEQQRAGRMMLKRTAKSCGSDAPMLAKSAIRSAGDGVKQAGS